MDTNALKRMIDAIPETVRATTLFGYADQVEWLLAEIARLNETIKWYQGQAGQRIGEAARAGIAGAPASVSQLAVPKDGPVAYAYECRQPLTDPVIWSEFFGRDKPSGSDWVRNVRPLYAAPDVAPLPARPEQTTIKPQGWNEKLFNFIDSVVEVAFEGGDIDGGTIQEWAETAGLLEARTMTEPCSEGRNCRCADGNEFPLTCYQKTYRRVAPLPELTGPSEAKIADERTLFEEWVKREAFNIGRGTIAEQYAWDAWQTRAARSAASPSPAPAKPTGPLYEEQPDGTITEVDQSDLIIAYQVAVWRKEVARLNDLIAAAGAAPAQQQEPRIAVLEARLTAIAKWLEQNQSDVFRRGLWDVVSAITSESIETAAPGASIEYQFRTRPDWHDRWSDWDRCTKGQYEDKLRTPLLHDWHYEVRALGVIATPAEQSTDKTAEK